MVSSVCVCVCVCVCMNYGSKIAWFLLGLYQKVQDGFSIGVILKKQHG